MSVTYYIQADGTAIPVGMGAQGLKGDPGADGLSAYDLWLNEGNSGTVQDFLQEIAPEAQPSRTTSTATASTHMVPTDASLHTLDVAVAATELDFSDFVSANNGTNPEGWTFTLHIATGADKVTFAPAVTVYGSVGTATDVWATVVREDNAWKVLIGASA